MVRVKKTKKRNLLRKVQYIIGILAIIWGFFGTFSYYDNGFGFNANHYFIILLLGISVILNEISKKDKK